MSYNPRRHHFPSIFTNHDILLEENCVSYVYQEYLYNAIQLQILIFFILYGAFLCCCSMMLNPAGIYLLKVNNRNTKTRCEICSKLTINTPERRHWRRSGVFIVNFEHISHLVLVFLLLTLNK